MIKFAYNEGKFTGHAALLTANVFFGLNLSIAKDVLSSDMITPLTLNAFRMVGAAILFWIASMFTKHERVSRHDLLLLFGASLLGVSINQLLFIYGLSLTTPIDASIIATLGPIITMLLAALYLKEPITWKKFTGVFIGVSGALLLILGGNHNIAGHERSLTGNLLCILSSISYASYLSFCKPVIMRYSSVTLMKWMFLFAAICCTPFFYNDISTLNFGAMSPGLVLRSLYVILFATFFAYILIPIGQKYMRPTLVSMYIYVQPLVAAIAAVALGQDSFGWHKALAGALVFTGVFVVTRSRAKERQ